eukprot:6036878-Prymnesium_polylepis.1
MGRPYWRAQLGRRPPLFFFFFFFGSPMSCQHPPAVCCGNFETRNRDRIVIAVPCRYIATCIGYRAYQN